MLTGDSFFHLSALGEALPGLNLCGAGRVVCLIDPIGDVYACPFVLHDEFQAGSVRDAGGFAQVWRESELFRELREPGSAGACGSCGSYDACQGGCMAAKFFTGLPLDGPDPECVLGHGEAALLAVGAGRLPPRARDTRDVRFRCQSPDQARGVRRLDLGLLSAGCRRWQGPARRFTAAVAETFPGSPAGGGDQRLVQPDR